VTGSLLRFACIAWLLMGAAAVPAQGLPEEVEACLAEVEREPGGAGPALLGERCPDLAERLAGTFWDASLEMPVQQLDAFLLPRLRRLFDIYERDAPTGPVLSTGSLAAIVDELAPFEVPPKPTRWERLLAWLETWLESETRGAGWLQWLRELSLPERWERGIVSVAASLIVLAALGALLGALLVAVNRIRLPRLSDRPSDPQVLPRDPVDLEQLPPARQLVVLLALIIGQLRRRSPRRFRDSLTHRELVAAAGDLEASQRRAIEAVARAAERITFGAWRPEPRDVEPIAREGRALLQALSDAGPQGEAR
jgi:hypothetical protein